MTKILDENTERLLLNEFVSTDGYRPILEHPFLQNGYVCATDTHVLIRIREDLAAGKYEEQDKPAVTKIIPQPNCEIIFPISKIEDALKRINLNERSKFLCECDECRGTGEVNWEYVDKSGHRHTMYEECPVCDGECELHLGYARFIAINGHNFAAWTLFLLRATAKIYGVDSVIIRCLSKKGSSLVEIVDGVEILMMANSVTEPETEIKA